MTTYLITGPRPVAGRPPGNTVEDGDLDGCRIEALVTGGHLAPQSPKSTRPDTNEEK